MRSYPVVFNGVLQSEVTVHRDAPRSASRAPPPRRSAHVSQGMSRATQIPRSEGVRRKRAFPVIGRRRWPCRRVASEDKARVCTNARCMSWFLTPHPSEVSRDCRAFRLYRLPRGGRRSLCCGGVYTEAHTHDVSCPSALATRARTRRTPRDGARATRA
jgi:hypothetical protein